MKKKFAVVAILGAISSVANAQFAVTIYGIVDAGFVREQGGLTNISKNNAGVRHTF